MSVLGQVQALVTDRAAAAREPCVTDGVNVLLVTVEDADHGTLAGLAHRPDVPGEVAADAPASGLAARATAAGSPLERAVGVATLNALSAPDMAWQGGDPMASLPASVDVVATVGLFRPAFRKFDEVTVRVVEREPPDPEHIETPAGVTVETYRPSACATAFADADICFVTGSTFIYGGFDRYLSALSAAGVSPVVLVGATASHRPEPAFDAGVDVVAGAQVTDLPQVRKRVRAGDCGTDLHDNGVEKVYVETSADLSENNFTRGKKNT